jgi:hypothetical protein
MRPTGLAATCFTSTVSCRSGTCATRLLRRICILLPLALAPACAEKPDLSMAERFDPQRTGPTTLARVAGGYELRNRLVRVVIDSSTGDVVYWGSTDGSTNLLASVGSASAVRGIDSAGGAATGYVEKRDDQTWQYIGDDPGRRIRWRKIFCLDGHSLLATYIVENQGTTRLDGLVALRIPLAEGATARIAQPDLYQITAPLGDVELRGFRERPYDRYFDDPVATLLSDSFQLRPGERFSFTTEWRMEPRLP